MTNLAVILFKVSPQQVTVDMQLHILPGLLPDVPFSNAIRSKSDLHITFFFGIKGAISFVNIVKCFVDETT